MDKEELTLVGVILLIVLLICLLAFGGCHDTEVTEREAIKAGLVQKQNVGSTGSHWTKP
jgi:hypothetical protein